MAKRKPSYRLHKASGQAVVVLSGKSHYLGLFDSPESRRKYDRLIAEYAAGQQHNSQAVRYGATCDQLVVAFMEHANSYYRKDGQLTAEYRCYKAALKYVSKLYGDSLAIDFGPGRLITIRESMIRGEHSRQPLSRKYINKSLIRIRSVFRWAVQKELLPATVWHTLQAVDALRSGRSVAIEHDPVTPVSEEVLHATLKELEQTRPEIHDMIELQLLTGMRPGEVCRMRPDEIDRSGEVWHYRPKRHKMQHKGRPRIIAIGPRGQAILQRDGRLFREVAFVGSKRQELTVEAYRTVIRRAARRAGVERWKPNQLRHNHATRIAKVFDIETAKTLLGHKDERVTEIYAERDMQRVHHAALQVG